MQMERAERERQFRLAELRVKADGDKEALELHRWIGTLRRDRDKSLAVRTKRYGDAQKNVLPKCQITHRNYRVILNS